MWALVIAAVGLGGCARTQTSATPGEYGNTDGVVIEVSVGGGLVPPPVRVSDSLPRTWIAGDGRYLRQAPDGSANPALITLEERRIPEAALPGLINSARDVGLFEDKPDYGDPRFADAMVTRIVVTADGERHTVLVSALGYPNLGLTNEQLTARAQLSGFLDLLGDPEKIAGVSSPSIYPPTEIAVYILGATSDSVTTPPATWPLGKLGTGGTVTDWPDRSARCFVVTGGDAEAVISAAAGKDRLTPWRAPDGVWDIALRPLLPDEHSCADVVG